MSHDARVRRPHVDPRLLPLLWLGRLDSRRSIELSIPEARARSERAARSGRDLVMSPGPRCIERDILVPVGGTSITVRMYWPNSREGRAGDRRPDARRAGAPRPLHVFIHGGGWCVGTLYERDPRCREIAVGADCVVASIEYRLAPEHPFPVPLEDCYAALCWLADHGGELDVDPARLSIGGESAGANLAASACLLARDRGGPRIRHQWLDVPAVDLTLGSPSIEEVPDGYLLDRHAIDTYLNCYLGDRALASDPAASPLLAGDLSRLPPAWVTGCAVDKLRDDATRYAAALRSAGVPVQSRILPGMFHAAFAFTRILPAAKQYERASIGALAGALRTVAA
ncbi:MAG: alpha/beta hydrolase [Actinobacteria bacterium]|nr:alpha/beta hydrolase [Actinomycetota bacterium]